MDRTPLTAEELAALRADAQNIRAAAKRKGVTLDDWDEKRETEAAQQHFNLGCWLHYYSRRVYAAEGLRDRIDCARRIFLAGLQNPGYRFFTVFDFGERNFDTIFEMGDADQVINELRQLAKSDKTGRIAQAFTHFGWPLEAVPAAPENKSIVAVGYWDSRAYRESGETGGGKPFLMEVADQRESHGQLFIDVANSEGNVDDMMCATVEINRLPGSKDDTQCLHLHFDDSNLAASFYKQGDKFIIRPESGVSIRNTILPNGESGWILE